MRLGSSNFEQGRESRKSAWDRRASVVRVEGSGGEVGKVDVHETRY